MYKGTLAVLTQSELLEFERMLASAPEVYDYCAHMTDQQLNYLIAFLSRSRENTMIESRQVKEALDEALRASASKDETLKAQDAELEELKAALKEKDAALAKKDRVIRDKNKTLAKKDNALAEKDKHISDLEEQLEESKVNRYGRRRMKSKDEKASGKSEDVKDDKNKDDDSGNNGSNANPGRSGPPAVRGGVRRSDATGAGDGGQVGRGQEQLVGRLHVQSEEPSGVL